MLWKKKEEQEVDCAKWKVELDTDLIKTIANNSCETTEEICYYLENVFYVKSTLLALKYLQHDFILV